MITATSGLTLNHGWVRGYRFNTDPVPPPPLPPEWADNRGKVLLYVIDGVVEFINVTWAPMAQLLVDGQNNIVDNNDMTVTITAGDTVETIVFDPEDEGLYSILVSNPLIKMVDWENADNSLHAAVGWKWDGTSFSE